MITKVECEIKEQKEKMDKVRRMVEVGGIEIKENDEVEILGRTFVIYIENNLAGGFVVWQDKNSLMRIYATPNFEMDGVPIQVEYDSYNITQDSYEGKINDYEHYKQITKDKIEKLLKDIHNLPKCDCITKYGTEHKHLEIKGWDFSICEYCSNVVDEKKNNEEKREEKDILNKETVIEEIKKLLDEYFEKKAKELKLISGDLDPIQVFIYEDSIEKIADIIVEWAYQNSLKALKEMRDDK